MSGRPGPRHVYIRADASTAIGLGHLIRCSALAAGLRGRGHAVTFLTRAAVDGALGCVRDVGADVRPVSVESEAEDLALTLSEIGSDPSALLVLDSYALGETFQRGVKSAGIRLAVIDDLAEGYFCADLVLNQNAYAPNTRYDTAPYTRLLLGTRYALLRPEFWPAPSAPPAPRSAPTTVLVSLGGGDPCQQTIKVVKALAGLPLDLEVLVVLGPAFPHTGAVAQAVAEQPKRFILHQAPRSMRTLMEQADLAICGAGSTCWELAYLGVPAITLVLADNQKQNAAALADAGFSISLGWWEQVNEQQIAATVSALVQQSDTRARMSRAGRDLVDGEGVARTVQVLEEL